MFYRLLQSRTLASSGEYWSAADIVYKVNLAKCQGTNLRRKGYIARDRKLFLSHAWLSQTDNGWFEDDHIRLRLHRSCLFVDVPMLYVLCFSKRFCPKSPIWSQLQHLRAMPPPEMPYNCAKVIALIISHLKSKHDIRSWACAFYLLVLTWLVSAQGRSWNGSIERYPKPVFRSEWIMEDSK